MDAILFFSACARENQAESGVGTPLSGLFLTRYRRNIHAQICIFLIGNSRSGLLLTEGL